jgi:hypothetical protein
MSGKRRRPKGVSSEQIGSLAAAAVQWLFDSVGATHPIRLGLCVSFAIAARGMVAVFAAHFPILKAASELDTYQLAGISFFLFFFPLLFNSVPENVRETLTLIRIVARKARLTRAERKLIYIAMLQQICESQSITSSIDFRALKASTTREIEQLLKSREPGPSEKPTESAPERVKPDTPQKTP